jgi:hypothetical protein
MKNNDNAFWNLIHTNVSKENWFKKRKTKYTLLVNVCVGVCLKINSKHKEKWHDIVGLKMKCQWCCLQPAATVHFNLSPHCVTQTVQLMLFKEYLRVVAS